MPTDIKLSEAQISKTIQSGETFGSSFGNLEKKPLTNIAIPLARDSLPALKSNLTLNGINKFERIISGKGVVRARKGFTLFILNEDVDDIANIIKSLEDSGVLIDRVTERAKNKIKKQEGGFLGALLALWAAHLVQPAISSVVKGISGRGVWRTGRGHMDENF